MDLFMRRIFLLGSCYAVGQNRTGLQPINLKMLKYKYFSQ